MKTMVLATLAAFTIGAAQAQTKPIKVISGKDTLITANRTWVCDTIYFLKGHVYVTNGAELTIRPGTVITGDSTTKGALIITKGSKIHAIGTASCPIVFTSPKRPNKRNRGDWGGVILLGKASVNSPGGINYIEGLNPGPLTQYGGGLTPDDNDNSGEVEFVRIEFAGVALSPNNEINGLTFGGVGRGTTIDFVQVSYANDDSYEWFGGTVNCRHLIAFRGIDDDFDTDQGYSGKLQFGIGIRDPQVADISGSSGYESDNDANSSYNLPQTKAIFCNFTVEAGADTTNNPLFRDGARIRRNSHLNMLNSILMGYPQGITSDGAQCDSMMIADSNLIRFNIVTCLNPSKYVVSVLGNATTVDKILNHRNNRFFAGNTQVLLANPYNLNNPNVRPILGSPALTGANFNIPPLNDPFFTHTNFVGALAKQAAQNWATTWVNWTPTRTAYTGPCACSTGVPASADVDEVAAPSIAEVKVSPNPSRGNFNVELNGFSGKVAIKVSNMNGTVIYTKEITGGPKNVVNVSLSRALPGLYYVTVNDDKNMITSKVSVN
jgi:hypothetical protein